VLEQATTERRGEMSLTDKVFRCENVELVVPDRDKLKSLKDENFENQLDVLVGWAMHTCLAIWYFFIFLYAMH